MQNEAIEVGRSSLSPMRLNGTLTSCSTAGHGTVHHRKGGSLQSCLVINLERSLLTCTLKDIAQYIKKEVS
jgi:hypothetical protein